uniref:Uncharacterized protein n=1 Tax=Amorphochlora amoebiformis TaxID=1561963 RepID=A0A7S0DM13_9EUKA
MATAGIYLENYNSQASGSRSGFSTQFGSVSVSKAVLTSSRARGDTQQVNGHQINYHQVNGHQINGHQRDHREARTPHSYATSTGLTGLMPLNDPTNSPTASSGIASPQMGRQTNKNRSVVSTLAEPLPTEDTDLEEPQGMVAKMHLHRRDSKLESHPDIHPGFPESQPRISTHQQFGTHHHVATSSSLGPPLMSPMATTASAPGSRPASSASHGVLSLGGHGNGYGGSGNHGIVHHVGGHHGQRPSSRSVSIFTPDEKYGSGGGAGPGSGRSAHVSLKVSSSPKKRTVSARAKANKIFCRAVASAAGFTKNLTSFTFLNVPELKTGEDAHDTKQLCTQISILKGLATVFDDAKGEAFTLMNRDSFRRFARSIAKTTRTRAVTSYAKDPKEVKRLHLKERVHDV